MINGSRIPHGDQSDRFRERSGRPLRMWPIDVFSALVYSPDIVDDVMYGGLTAEFGRASVLGDLPGRSGL